MTGPRHIILLQQVEGPRWCVTERALIGGKSVFVDRIVTARSYAAARDAALQAAQLRRLVLAIHGNGQPTRAFDPKRDMLDPETGQSYSPSRRWEDF